MKRDPTSSHLSKQINHWISSRVPRFQVDTVGLKFPESSWIDKVPKGWTVRKTQHIRREDGSEPSITQRQTAVMFIHEESGLRVGGNQDGASWAEGSLPRALNGDNTALIYTEERLRIAKDIFNKRIAEVCPLWRPSKHVMVKRLDLVKHVRAPLDIVIAAHRASRHPKFHREAAQWLGESLVFKGRYRMCRMYDPALLKTGEKGLLTRVEWQLRSPTLARDFGYEVRWIELTLEECYRIYRSLCLGFDCSEVASVDSIYHFLALAELNNWMHAGVPALELYLKSKKRCSVNRIRRKIASLRPKAFNFRWIDLLPPTLEEYLKLNGLK